MPPVVGSWGCFDRGGWELREKGAAPARRRRRPQRGAPDAPRREPGTPEAEWHNHPKHQRNQGNQGNQESSPGAGPGCRGSMGARVHAHEVAPLQVREQERARGPTADRTLLGGTTAVSTGWTRAAPGPDVRSQAAVWTQASRTARVDGSASRTRRKRKSSMPIWMRAWAESAIRPWMLPCSHKFSTADTPQNGA